jgi:hypothetical protein
VNDVELCVTDVELYVMLQCVCECELMFENVNVAIGNSAISDPLRLRNGCCRI